LPFGKSGDELVAEGRVSATTQETWIDYDTLDFMYQIDALPQSTTKSDPRRCLPRI
jgi:hypothetical protein